MTVDSQRLGRRHRRTSRLEEAWGRSSSTKDRRQIRRCRISTGTPPSLAGSLPVPAVHVLLSDVIQDLEPRGRDCTAPPGCLF